MKNSSQIFIFSLFLLTTSFAQDRIYFNNPGLVYFPADEPDLGILYKDGIYDIVPITIQQEDSIPYIMNTLISSVDIDSVITIVKILTGESTYSNNGHEDSIRTRFSLSPDIYKAQDFLKSKLENIGYQVDLQPFNFNNYSGVKFAPDQKDIGWVISYGIIWGTTDGGESWEVQYYDSLRYYIYRIFPLDHNNVFAVGEGMILKTDNGADWQLINAPNNETFWGVYFIDENTGWVCGTSGSIYKTLNGGNS